MELTNENTAVILRKVKLILMVSVSFALGTISDQNNIVLFIIGVLGTFWWFRYSLTREDM